MVKKKDSPKIKELKHQARNHSITEGIFCTAKNSFGHHYVSPFAIAINSSNSMVAMLTSIAGLLGPLSQVFGSRLPEKYSRKKILLKTISLEALMWIPFITIAILFYKGILISTLPIILLLSFAIYSILGGIGHPAWFSWMGDIVNKKQRGRWFSKRNLITGFVSVILVILASIFLDYFKKNNWTMFGFIILFSLALISRLISLRSFQKQYEPKIELKKESYFSFWDFLINSPKNNVGRFSLFRFFFTFACAISSPLLAIYLLRNLGFSYTIYMIITFAGTALSLLVLELWGKFSDKYGNYITLCIASGLITIIPILWILNTNPIYLILVPSTISGLAWAGLHLTEKNFIYDNVSPQKRGFAVSYYNLFWGLGVFFGAGLGAILIKFVNTDFIEPILLIFIIGGVARAIAALWWLPKMREVRKTKKFKSSQAFNEIILKGAAPTIHEEVNQIIHIQKYLRD
ncbi:MFS transporter [Candidatus Pacearchaeota archaeon]|nr:MFS transporter [Candidatus Pacearchaeota archaeon]